MLVFELQWLSHGVYVIEYNGRQIYTCRSRTLEDAIKEAKAWISSWPTATLCYKKVLDTNKKNIV